MTGKRKSSANANVDTSIAKRLKLRKRAVAPHLSGPETPRRSTAPSATNDSGKSAFIPFRATENDTQNYHALSPSSREIRYISLEPSDDNAEDSKIVCFLGYISLDNKKRIPYEALSYCWGDVSDTVPITLLHPVRYEVTKNLAAALRNLRYKDKHRVLWVDAICINQEDPIERSEQVRDMSQVYSQAERVLIWLGEENLSCQLAVKYMDLLAVAHGNDGDEEEEEEEEEEEDAIGDVQGDIGEDSGDGSKFHIALKGLYRLEKEHERISIKSLTEDLSDEFFEVIVHTLGDLLSRPWFRRVWVVREVLCTRTDLEDAYQNGRIIVNIGRMRIPWGMFFMSIDRIVHYQWDRLWHFLHTPVRRQAYHCLMFYESWLELWRSVEPEIVDLLVVTHGFQASDPRDRLFALLGLAIDSKDSDSHLIRPDYTKSLVQSCWDPLKEPSDARFLNNCLRMFGMGEGNDSPDVWSKGFMSYLEYYGTSTQIRDTGFFSDCGPESIRVSCRFFNTKSGELGYGDLVEEGDVVVALQTAKFPSVIRPCQEPELEGKFRFVVPCLFYGQQPMNHEMYLPTAERPLEVFELV
ncbi:HET-domain-containing protein [Trematosphaeria pertusa]|uniref:HET-domain-containing protein n=1 Tax=Trematosphaeria pertusa TaxID=390896 RepID=A0A6A6IM90_9PLEO|nr:HET-domain-containing protein [Trematosphaeria pertusa]KAF2251561.1 HET-domain-containing protein [Trematosphaeria pertusa]